jgi:hypothetical protein
MKQPHLVVLLVIGLGVPQGLTAGQATPRYTNAVLVSVDIQTRIVVIKNSAGRKETLQMDDNLAGLDGLRAGDPVILTVRSEPGMARVSSIRRSVANATSPNPAPLRPAEVPLPVAAALQAFSDQVATFARQAGQVDALWNDFKTTCNVTLQSSYSDGRDWFSLWDGTAQMDMSGGACRDLFNQIVGQGEAVKSGMAGAEEAARKAALEPGSLRSVLRRNSMEWGGWSLPAPDSLKQ